MDEATARERPGLGFPVLFGERPAARGLSVPLSFPLPWVCGLSVNTSPLPLQVGPERSFKCLFLLSLPGGTPSTPVPPLCAGVIIAAPAPRAFGLPHLS